MARGAPGTAKFNCAKKLISPGYSSGFGCIGPLASIFPLVPSGKSDALSRAVPRSIKEGRFAIVTSVGCGMRWTKAALADE